MYLKNWYSKHTLVSFFLNIWVYMDMHFLLTTENESNNATIKIILSGQFMSLLNGIMVWIEPFFSSCKRNEFYTFIIFCEWNIRKVLIINRMKQLSSVVDLYNVINNELLAILYYGFLTIIEPDSCLEFLNLGAIPSFH